MVACKLGILGFVVGSVDGDSTDATANPAPPITQRSPGLPAARTVYMQVKGL